MNVLENAPTSTCYRAPRWPDPDFHEKYPKNTPKPESLDSQKEKPKIPFKYSESTDKKIRTIFVCRSFNGQHD